MFWEILELRRIEVLKKITNNMPEMGMENSYLAGGTALALQLGHRKSYDFDWFIPEEFNPEELKQSLEKIGRVRDVKLSKATLHLNFEAVRVTWLYYPNPVLKPLLQIKEPVELKIASIEDIALMKLVAISSRGAKRDFVDLYYICKEGFSINNLIAEIPSKYPTSDLNKYHIVKSLSYFEDADKEVLDPLSIPWEEIKRYFSKQAKSVLEDFRT